MSGTTDSTYVRKPPYFEGMPAEPEPVADITGARVLALLGDSVTTDHISPAGSIKPGTPAAQYLDEHGVERKDYNSFGSRRGNHEVMIRGTFANIRLRNQLLDGIAGACPAATPATSPRTGPRRRSSTTRRKTMRHRTFRWWCWAARSTGRARHATGRPRARALLGVRAVIAESFERIHRSNLIGMGVIPLQFPDGKSAKDAGSGRHRGVRHHRYRGAQRRQDAQDGACEGQQRERRQRRKRVEFDAVVRIDTPGEADYYRNGGILQYVLRNMLKSG